jgi:cytoskeletal protein CcmA (bactofilin family)
MFDFGFSSGGNRSMQTRRFCMAWGSGSSSAKREGAATKSDAIENIIGRSCLIRGDLSSDGAFRIDGTIEGSVESQASIVLGESGVIRGGVRGTDVVIAGTVQGDVTCSGHLEILAKGKIEGDIEAKSMRIETGGVFCGTSRMGGHGRDSVPGAIPVSADLSSAA